MAVASVSLVTATLTAIDKEPLCRLRDSSSVGWVTERSPEEAHDRSVLDGLRRESVMKNRILRSRIALVVAAMGAPVVSLAMTHGPAVVQMAIYIRPNR